jgi:hypothetical protein
MHRSIGCSMPGMVCPGFFDSSTIYDRPAVNGADSASRSRQGARLFRRVRGLRGGGRPSVVQHGARRQGAGDSNGLDVELRTPRTGLARERESQQARADDARHSNDCVVDPNSERRRPLLPQSVRLSPPGCPRGPRSQGCNRRLGRLPSSATRSLMALREGLADGGVVGHRTEWYEVAYRLVAHHDLVGHGVDERPSGGGVDVGEEGQP